MTLITQEAVTRVAPPSLEDRLAEFIDREHITGNYDTAGIVARLVKANHASLLDRWLTQDPGYLRHRAENIKDHADLTPGQEYTENYFHGNGNDDLVRWSA